MTELANKASVRLISALNNINAAAVPTQASTTKARSLRVLDFDYSFHFVTIHIFYFGDRFCFLGIEVCIVDTLSFISI